MNQPRALTLRTRSQRQGKSASINITSLMDVLTIILIFLLVNYSDFVNEENPPQFLHLPTVMAEPGTTDGADLLLQVGLERIDVDGQSVIYSDFKAERERVLNQVGDLLKRSKSLAPNGGENLKVTLQADQQVPYEMIDQLLIEAGEQGLTKVDLVALAQME